MSKDVDYDEVKEYLACASVGYGAGSYAVDKTAFEAIRRCHAILKSDWKPSGPGYIHVYDVTHVDRWSGMGTGRLTGHKDGEKTSKEVPYLFSVSADFGPAPKKRK